MPTIIPIQKRDYFIGKFKSFAERNPRGIHTQEENTPSRNLGSQFPVEYFLDVKADASSLVVLSNTPDHHIAGCLNVKFSLLKDKGPKLTFNYLFNNHDNKSQSGKVNVSSYDVEISGDSIPQTLQELIPDLTPCDTPLLAPEYYLTYLDFIVQKLES